MSPEKYHEVLIGLDRALFVFHEAETKLDASDRELVERIAAVRSEVIRVGTQHPFPKPGDQADPDLTQAPWI